MTTYAMIRYTVTDGEAYARYGALAGPSLKEHGGALVLKGPTTGFLEGSDSLDNHVVIAFESRGAAVAWYESTEYQNAIAERVDAGEMSIALVDA